MIRPRRAPWVLAISFILASGAALAAAPPSRSARGCIRYSQKMDAGRSGVLVKLDNRCRTAVTCSIEWTLTCAGERGGAESAQLSLERGAAGSVHATATACGDRDWELTGLRWSCTPREPQ